MDDSEQTTKRPVVSDGKIDREIWRPEDSNGDASIKTYEATQYDTEGHPTWKLYCGDAPENAEGVIVEPPKNCYLDDRAAYKILNWDGYTKAERGRFWRNDFSNKGEIRPHRKHRGRPALMPGGEIASLQGNSRVYRFSGAEHPNDIATINEELARQKENKALARLMPSTNIPSAKSPAQSGRRASKQPLRISTSPTNTTSDDFDRDRSFFTAELQDSTHPNHAKRPRLEYNMRPIPSSKQPNAAIIIADLKTQNLALNDRNELISGKVHNLTREKGYLQTELESTKTLWAATSRELAHLRAQYLETQDALRTQANGEVNTVSFQAVKNDLSVYRNLAKQLFGKLQSSAGNLEQGVTAIHGVKRLAEELGVTPKNELPLEHEYGSIQRDLDNIRESMKAVLGEGWARFESEVLAERDI